MTTENIIYNSFDSNTYHYKKQNSKKDEEDKIILRDKIKQED